MLAVKDEEERCPAGEQLKCNPQQQQQQHQQQNQTKFLTVFFFCFIRNFHHEIYHIFSSCVVLIEIQKTQFKTSSLVLWLSHTHTHMYTRTTYAYSYINSLQFSIVGHFVFSWLLLLFRCTRLRIIIFTFSFGQQAENTNCNNSIDEY